MKIQLQPGKTEYTEEEAARALGLSATQFRTLLIRHVITEEAALSNVGLMRFRPSDLLLLSVLGSPRPAAEESPSHQ